LDTAQKSNSHYAPQLSLLGAFSHEMNMIELRYHSWQSTDGGTNACSQSVRMYSSQSTTISAS